MGAIVSHGYEKAISHGKFFFILRGVPMENMQTVHETRRQRIGMLKKKYDKWVHLNVALGWEKTNVRLSQIHSGTLRSDRGTPYLLGDETAREIELALGLPEGWMDTPPTHTELHGTPSAADLITRVVLCMEPEQQYAALRVVHALSQPAAGQASEQNGTNG
jgi:hypothetical protein